MSFKDTLGRESVTGSIDNAVMTVESTFGEEVLKPEQAMHLILEYV